MNRQSRAQLAEETLRILEEGSYLAPSGRRVEVRELISCAKAETGLFGPGDASVPRSENKRPTVVQVTAETTLEAVARLSARESGHIACLNFASAKNPGGGFQSGSQAQEESLARSSALYPCLLEMPEYYERNRHHHSALYLDLAIYSCGIPFFRNDEGALLEKPIVASVITCPAPNARAVASNSRHELPFVAPTLKRRARMVMEIAAYQQVNTLVLGAWGCGVFGNDPRLVSRTFAELVHDPSLGSAFDQVVFAVHDQSPDRRVIMTFQEELT